MIYHFDCPTLCGNPGIEALVFSWDEETGEITGPSAGKIQAAFLDGEVGINPPPASHALTSPKSKTDLAAVVGWNHWLPPELVGHYPQVDNADWDGTVRDDNGNVVLRVLF